MEEKERVLTWSSVARALAATVGYRVFGRRAMMILRFLVFDAIVAPTVKGSKDEESYGTSV